MEAEEPDPYEGEEGANPFGSSKPPERGATQQPKASILLSLRWPTGNAAEIYQHEHFIAARTWRPVCSP